MFLKKLILLMILIRNICFNFEDDNYDKELLDKVLNKSKLKDLLKTATRTTNHNWREGSKDIRRSKTKDWNSPSTLQKSTNFSVR